MHALLATALVAVAGMVLAVIKGVGGLLIVPAAIFVGVMIWSALRANRPDWAEDRAPEGAPADRMLAALGRNSRIMGVAYAFAAFALQTLYATPLTGLRWQHGWQYAMVFAVLAVIAFEYGRIVQATASGLRDRLARLAVPLLIGQAVLAGGSLAFLALSGKVFTRRPDWAANLVFLFAALLVMVLGAIALRTHAALTER